MRLTMVAAAVGLMAEIAGATTATTNTTVANPTKVNLVFNRSAVRDAANSSVASDVVFSPSGSPFATFSPSVTGTYAITLGRVYDVSAIEFIWGRYLPAGGAYIPLNFNLYAAASNVANLYQAAYKIADQSTAGVTNANRSPAADAEIGFNYQQVRYDLPAPQSVYKFGIQITSWQALGGGTDLRAFLLAASAFPRNAPLEFDGEIGIFNHTWAPGGSIAASVTDGGSINSTPIYDTDDWADPRWFALYWETGGGEIDITIHLSDRYRVTGIRWASAQTSPRDYQLFAADKATSPAGGDWIAVTPVINFPGGNQGSRVDFTSPFEGNWVQVRATATNPIGYWVNTKWQVYGGVISPRGTVIMIR